MAYLFRCLCHGKGFDTHNALSKHIRETSGECIRELSQKSSAPPDPASEASLDERAGEELKDFMLQLVAQTGRKLRKQEKVPEDEPLWQP